MLTEFLFFTGLAASAYAIGLYYQKIDILKLIAFTICIYFNTCIIASAAFFWLDIFQLNYVLALTLISISFSILFLVRCYQRLTFQIIDKKRSIWLYIIILSSLMISWEKFGFLGMGPDQGVYQTKAILLINHDSKREYSLPETDILGKTIQTLNLPGLYSYHEDLPFQENREERHRTTGIFHGIPTLPAILAIFGHVFGLGHMQNGQSLFLLATLIFIILISEELKLKTAQQRLAVALFGLSPIIAWVTKSALTEIFSCLLYAGMLYGLIAHNPKNRPLTIYCWTAFCFWHYTVYVFLPIIIFTHWCLYLQKKDRNYLKTAFAISLLFGIGITMMMYIAPRTTYHNLEYHFAPLYRMGKYQIMLPGMWGIVLLLIILTLIVSKINLDKYYQKLDNIRLFKQPLFKIVLIFFALAFGEYILLSFKRDSFSWESIRYLSIFELSYTVGFFPFFAALFYIFVRPKTKIFSEQNALIISAFFCYFCLLIPTFFMQTISYNYYYLRYFAPYVVIIAITIGYFLNSCRRAIINCLLILALIVVIPFNWTLMLEKDDTHVPWTVMDEIIKQNLAGANSAVIIDDEAFSIFALPLRSHNKVHVFPKLENVDEEIKILAQHYQNVYYLNWQSTQSGEQLISNASNKIIYRLTSTLQEDTQTALGAWIPFPHHFTSEQKVITLYQFITNDKIYNAQEHFWPNDEKSIWQDQTRWLTQKVVHFQVILDKENYQFHLTLGQSVPLEKINREQMPIHIILNDQEIGQFILTPNNQQEEFIIDIPEESVNDGLNDLALSGQTWSPIIYEQTDTRRLLINIKEMAFVKECER